MEIVPYFLMGGIFFVIAELMGNVRRMAIIHANAAMRGFSPPKTLQPQKPEGMKILYRAIPDTCLWPLGVIFLIIGLVYMLKNNSHEDETAC